MRMPTLNSGDTMPSATLMVAHYVVTSCNCSVVQIFNATSWRARVRACTRANHLGSLHFVRERLQHQPPELLH